MDQTAPPNRSSGVPVSALAKLPRIPLTQQGHPYLLEQAKRRGGTSERSKRWCRRGAQVGAPEREPQRTAWLWVGSRGRPVLLIQYRHIETGSPGRYAPQGHVG